MIAVSLVNNCDNREPHREGGKEGKKKEKKEGKRKGKERQVQTCGTTSCWQWGSLWYTEGTRLSSKRQAPHSTAVQVC